MPLPRQFRSLVLVILVAGVASGTSQQLAAEEPVTATGDDAAAKEAILHGEAWAQAVRGLNEWLSVQIIYSQAQMPQMRASFQSRVDAMPASQLPDFLADLQQKLAILSGPEALEARAWAEQRLNLLSDTKAAEFRKSMPDVANMSALQVAQALEDLKQKRATSAANYKAFEQFRDQQVATVRAQNQAQAKANAAAAATNRGGAGYHPGFSGGSYAPRKFRRYPGIGTGYRGGVWRGGYRW